jgi:hypothetical protein
VPHGARSRNARILEINKAVAASLGSLVLPMMPNSRSSLVLGSLGEEA